MDKCSGINQSGKACGGVPIEGSQWCFHHHPDNAERLKRAGRKGGRTGGRGRPSAELQALRVENAEIRKELRAGELEANTARVLIQSIGVDTRLIATTLDAKEQEELERRLEELEEALEHRRAAGPWA